MNIPMMKLRVLSVASADEAFIDDVITAIEPFCEPRTEEGIKKLCKSIVVAVIEQELMKVGNFKEGVFSNWDMSGEEVWGRIESEWNKTGRDLEFEYFCVFVITEKGNDFVQPYLNGVSRSVDALLSRGLSRVIHASELAYIIREYCEVTTPEDVSYVASDVIHCVVGDDYVAIGDDFEKFKPLHSDHRFAVACQVEDAWLALGRDPKPGEVCWFRNTARGDLHAKGLLHDLQICVEEVLVLGVARPVTAADVAEIARSVGGASTVDEAMCMSDEIVRCVAVTDKTMEILNLKKRALEWVDSVCYLATIRDAWRALGRDPRPGELFWLRNTAKGNEMARTLLEGKREGKGDGK